MQFLKKYFVRLKNRLFPVVLLFFHFPYLVAQGVGPTPVAGKPFPQHVLYGPGILIPNHVGRGELDDSVRSFYTAWKNRYIRQGCDEGQYYVWFEEPGRKQCVSEGQGYGMIIAALMAGSDSSAKTLYDGLFHYYLSHPSRSDILLMAWAQKKGCRDIDGSSATDGDMDIAYSLLLADAQWGSGGPVHYLEQGRRMIASILKQEINQKDFSVLLSNDVEPDSKDYSDMRSSDFMPAHFRAFRKASGDPAWDTVIDNNYRLFRYMQNTYSPEAGLIPDFINHISMGTESAGDARTQPGSILAAPARPHYLESRYDGRYYYNACRVPWRIATDVILNGDERAAAIVEKINHWIRSTTQGNPDNISAGYSLEGNDLPRHYFEALSFITPFAVSAMCGRDPGDQVWLDKLWDYIVHFRLRQFEYYDNSIKMINLIIRSGNYWAP
jgi:endoglucanase